MQVNVRILDHVVILDLQGRFTVEANTRRVPEVLNSVRQMGVNNVVLNLTQVRYLDCSGIGQLVICFQAVQEAGGGLRLVNVDRRYRKVLDLCGLSDVLEVCASEREAVESFPTEVRYQQGESGGQAKSPNSFTSLTFADSARLPRIR
jgi:anti-sigma B factor antagonist